MMRNTGFLIFLIAGRQLQTEEGLEVLAVAPDKEMSNGKQIGTTLSEAIASNGLAIVPWGFGKWVGKRGKALRKALESVDSRKFFLGDNSGRPKFSPTPLMFREGRRKGIHILPGSDPLPFRSEEGRAGSFGFFFDGTISFDRPAEHLKQKLTDPGFNFSNYGQLESIGRFIRNQLLMQIRKRATNKLT
jgi:hypothetical protein